MILNVAIFYLLVGRFRWSTISSTLVAFIVVNTAGFWLNKHFTYRKQTTPALPEAGRYFATMAVSLVANLTLMWSLVDRHHIHYITASLMVTVVLAVTNFLAHRRIAFGPTKPRRVEGRRRILLVTHYYASHGGGVEIVAGEIAKRLSVSHNYDIEWWASDTTPPPALDTVSAHPVRAWNALEMRLGIPIPLWSPIALAHLSKRVLAADVVHVHDLLYIGNLTAALAALILGRPLVVTQHISLVAYRNVLLRGLMIAGNRSIVRWILVRASRVIFIADSAKSYFDRYCRWRRAPVLVANGVDTMLYRPPTDAERRCARRSIRVEDGVPVALFVGRFVEKKGLALLEQVARATPDARFLFAGFGPIDPSSWSLPNVEVYRGCAGLSLRNLYWAANILLLPSVGEGFPLVVQEAMACGLKPLVSPDVASGSISITEHLLVENLGTNALERWRHRLQVACADGASGCRSGLAAVAAARWSWDLAAADYATIFGDVIGVSGRPL